MDVSYIEPCKLTSKGFRKSTLKPYGLFHLVVVLIFDLDPKFKTMRQLDFIVIDLPSTYNGFLMRPFEHEFDVASSTHYYCIKFPTPGGAVGTVNENQSMAR